MKKAIILAALLVIATAGVGRADVVEWKIDPHHTTLCFSIRHIVGQVEGRFEKFGGIVRMDPDHLDQSRISVVIDVNSIYTGVEQRDHHLRTADFFDADFFPLMRFEGDRIVHLSGDDYEAHGQLTIKDVTMDVAMPFTLLGIKKHPLPDLPCTDVAGIKAALKIKRLDYHVGDGKFVKMGMTGDDVDITIFSEMLSDRAGCKK